MTINKLISGAFRGDQVDPIQPIQPVGPGEYQGPTWQDAINAQREQFATDHGEVPSPSQGAQVTEPAGPEQHSNSPEQHGPDQHGEPPPAGPSETSAHDYATGVPHPEEGWQQPQQLPDSGVLTEQQAEERRSLLEAHDVPPEDIPKVAGVEPWAVQMIQEKMAGFGPGAYLDIKPGTMEAMLRREEGAVGKPEESKPKSIRDFEEWVGYGKGQQDHGFVGFGPPTMPDRTVQSTSGPDSFTMSDPMYDKVTQAFNKRNEEYNNQIADFTRYQQNGYNIWNGDQQMTVYPRISDGNVQWTNADGETRTLGPNVVYTVDANNQMVAPLSGDVDGFSLYNPAWGPPGTAEYHAQETAFWQEIAKDTGGVFQHDGNTVSWNPQSEKLQNLRADILWEYADNNPAGQNIMRVTPERVFMTRGPAVDRQTGQVMSRGVQQYPREFFDH